MSPRAGGAGPVSAVILAGGASWRLGRDKALVEIGGRPLLARVLDAAAPSADELLVVTADREAHGRALRDAGWRIADGGRGGGPGARARLRLLSDRRPGRGPLAGLEAGLAEARHDLCLALACDLPFLPPEVPARLLEALARWREGAGASGPPRAMVPVAGGRRQSLCVAVERRGGAEAAACLDADEPSVAAWLGRLDVREMTLRELAEGHEQTGAARRWMMDVDTPDALEEARRLAAEAGPP
jgi:molybdopterin-guanine dinucleotide biosynthesis protein A